MIAPSLRVPDRALKASFGLPVSDADLRDRKSQIARRSARKPPHCGRAAVAENSRRDLKQPHGAQLRKLIAGPTVFVCDECVELCMDIISEKSTFSLVKSGDGIPTPNEIRKVLDDYVIGQDHPKKGSLGRCS